MMGGFYEPVLFLDMADVFVWGLASALIFSRDLVCGVLGGGRRDWVCVEIEWCYAKEESGREHGGHV